MFCNDVEYGKGCGGFWSEVKCCVAWMNYGKCFAVLWSDGKCCAKVFCVVGK